MYADRRISISWVADHRRSSEIAAVVHARAFFVRATQRLLPLRYFSQLITTRRILRQERPSLIVVMQPPPFALFAVIGFARRSGALVLGDLHSGVFFDPKWKWAVKLVLRALRAHGAAIVPNGDLAQICREAGVKTFVCHGLISPLDHHHDCCETDVLDKASNGVSYVLVPLAYAYDEPINEILQAARLTPSVRWVLTGRAPDRVRSSAPENCFFPGYVSSAEYQTLRAHASVVLALTTDESTMQSAGYEATAAATPLITVATRVLVDYYKDAARYTGLTPGEISAAVNSVLESHSVWRAKMERLRDSVIAEQQIPGDEVEAWLIEKGRTLE